MRFTFYLTYAYDEVRFGQYFRFLITQLHPIFSLNYKHDLQVSRFMRFLVLYTRLMLIMGLSFLILRDEGGEDSDPWGGKVIGFSVLGSLLLLPMPIYMFYLCRTRYYIDMS
mmetsp:Transcript_23891/g.18241  ORF Transcript_23891/g.18241 Transcript_23891/m.18241 type:complete len:112 (+) Transcript_23891:1210-1545(+)